jgi:hypothetical protein
MGGEADIGSGEVAITWGNVRMLLPLRMGKLPLLELERSLPWWWGDHFHLGWGESFSGKEDASEFRGLMSPTFWGASYTSQFKLHDFIPSYSMPSL